jgi:hypothetical protein
VFSVLNLITEDILLSLEEDGWTALRCSTAKFFFYVVNVSVLLSESELVSTELLFSVPGKASIGPCGLIDDII